MSANDQPNIGTDEDHDPQQGEADDFTIASDDPTTIAQRVTAAGRAVKWQYVAVGAGGLVAVAGAIVLYRRRG